MATKFTAEFLEQRMQAHRLWCHEVEHALVEEIITEVQQLPLRKPKPGNMFVQMPSHLEEARP